MLHAPAASAVGRRHSTRASRVRTMIGFIVTREVFGAGGVLFREIVALLGAGELKPVTGCAHPEVEVEAAETACYLYCSAFLRARVTVSVNETKR